LLNSGAERSAALAAARAWGPRDAN